MLLPPPKHFSQYKNSFGSRLEAAAHESLFMRRSRGSDSTSHCAPGFLALAVGEEEKKVLATEVTEVRETKREREMGLRRGQLVYEEDSIAVCFIHPSFLGAL
jgi:hypothetical protein